jgi:hypothetical protein
MKIVKIIEHAKERIAERGASESEVRETIRDGISVRAKKRRKAKEKIFAYGKPWQGQTFPHKKLKVVYVEEGNTLVVITVYVYYGRWEE